MTKIDSQLLLESFPHPAMIIREDRRILAANDSAIAAGAEVGDYCWKGFGNAANLSDEHYNLYQENPDHEGIQCTFCRADNCLTKGAKENDPLLSSDVGIFDTYWVPINSDTYLHFAIDITERKQSEELLRQSEERLKLVLKGSNDAPWDWDLVRSELYYSPQWWQQLGYVHNEVPADAALWNRLLHPEDKKRVDDLFSNALKSNTETYQVEFRLLHKDGHYVPVLSRGFISRDENNEPTRVTGANTDLTERKQKEQELLKSQQLLTQMGKISQVGGWVVDLDNETLTWTEEVYKIHEVDSDYVPNVDAAINFYTADSKPLIAEAVKRAIDFGESFDLELEIQTAKGNRRTVHARGLVDHNNRRIYGAFQDITQRKKAEEEILRLKDRLLMANEAAQIGVWDLNVRENILVWDDRMFQLYGVSREETSSTVRAWINGLHPEDKDSALAAYQAALNGEKDFDTEFRVLRPDGAVRHIKANGLVIMGEDGKPDRILGVNVDVTEHKGYEEELLYARNIAEKATRAKSEFLANVSHEIRTPMNGIIGMAQLLEMTDLNAEQRDYLQTLRLSSDNLLALINDVLDLSKIETGHFELEQAPFTLRSSLNAVVRTQLSVAQGKGLDLVVAFAEDVPDRLIGDSLRLKQIVLNLLSNAIKFTSRGEVRLHVDLADLTAESVQLKLSVFDTGIGIDPADLQKLFKPFSQANATIAETFGGTGLGLAICRHLVELMGGLIQVTSDPGHGSTFSVRLPFALYRRAGSEAPRPDQPTGSPLWSGAPLHVLIADDNEMNLMVTSRFLEKAGFTVQTAANGQQALQAWQEASFDAILMDIQMPVLDGIEATRLIREQESRTDRHTTIIALTARALREERELILKQGFDDYVSKPLNLQALFDSLAHGCGPQQGGG